jgi:hypothetical protein
MAMKQFLVKISFVILPLLALCVIYPVFYVPAFTGDLGRLAQIPFGKEYDLLIEKDFPEKYHVKDTLILNSSHVQFGQKPTVITIGDSYSGMGKTGYQNYLALHGLNVVNFVRKHAQDSPVKIISAMLNDNMIDSTTCKAVIVQTGSRNCISRLQESFDTISYKSIKEYIPANNSRRPLNLLNLCSFIRLQFGYDSPVLKAQLDRQRFSHKWGDRVYYYKEDLWFQYTKKEDIETAKENLKILNDKFLQKGIKLVFLICADKYDVYRPFMTDSNLPVDTLTDDFDSISGICVIDTKPLLCEMVREGKKDVCFMNDSHSSHIANKAIAEKIYYTLNSLQLLK